MAKTRRRKLEIKLDKLWAQAVRKPHCEFCGRTDQQMNSHHIIRRTHKATRWHLSNGVNLCGWRCHKMIAHSKMTEVRIDFDLWLIETLLPERGFSYENLVSLGNSIYKPSLDELEDKIIELQEYGNSTEYS